MIVFDGSTMAHMFPYFNTPINEMFWTYARREYIPRGLYGIGGVGTGYRDVSLKELWITWKKLSQEEEDDTNIATKISKMLFSIKSEQEFDDLLVKFKRETLANIFSERTKHQILDAYCAYQILSMLRNLATIKLYEKKGADTLRQEKNESDEDYYVRSSKFLKNQQFMHSNKK
jgi:hypothetical protein